MSREGRDEWALKWRGIGKEQQWEGSEEEMGKMDEKDDMDDGKVAKAMEGEGLDWYKW